ncbi:MGAT4 family member D [Rhinolophus ferrumequinum]|uniref:MGAT4 family member D n=1 Tax=Rhinolophus ferrumequinum TaxID=59479 RepID=A0A671F0J6_RHIFE|nr:MGAT4 family member D [Rhinolophus ferrumequinum]
MKATPVNLLIALVAFVLFSFSCFCISRMTQTSNQLINCRNHILEFKGNILRLKNKSVRNRHELMKALNRMKNDIRQREHLSVNLGKLFKSEDLTDFVRFFLTFYKDKPIDLLLEDFFRVKMCNPGETLEKCAERNKQIRVKYKPSLFQHVDIQSSFPITEQYYKKI